jgi:predicted dehydrogenase
VKVLLVGLGRWGAQHWRVLRELGVDVWVADIDPERRAWARAQGLPAERVLADFRQALDRVDAVDVVTPADSHLAVAEAALQAGRPCFVEKPLALTAADGRRLCTGARVTGGLLQVGHILRFHPVTAALREALARDQIGPVRFIVARFAGFKRPRTDVGVTQTDAIHFVDLCAHLLGRRATAVQAVQRDYLGRGLDDMSVTVVEFDGVPAVIQADYFVPGTWRECVVVGERGSLVADFGGFSLTLHRGEHRHAAHGWEAVERGQTSLAVERAEPLRVELETFCAACAGRVPNPVPPEAGVHALEVVEAAARAARERRAVELQTPR